jgi:arabinogalactan endo-1,4-beta-galactosidase
VPKEGAGTSSQKGHVVFSPLARKILDRKRTKILKSCSAQHQRKVAETDYPFTLDCNDWTNNLVGLSNQGATINHRLRLGNQALLDFDNKAVPALTEFGLVEAKKVPIHMESYFPAKTFAFGSETKN